MKYLPYENITYKTRLNHDEIIGSLNNITEPRKYFRVLFNTKQTKSYQGEVHDTGFNIMRIVYYRNAFLPVIKGTFAINGDDLEINVEMRLHSSIIVFLSIWIGIISIVAFKCATVLILNRKFIINNYSSVQLTPWLIPIGLLVFAFIFIIVGFNKFKVESCESKNYFKTLFEAEMLEN